MELYLMCSAWHSSPLALSELHWARGYASSRVCISMCVSERQHLCHGSSRKRLFLKMCCSNIRKWAMWEKAPLGREAWMALDIFMPFLLWSPWVCDCISPSFAPPCHRCSKAQSDLSWHLYFMLVHKASEKYSTDTHSHVCHPPITLKGEKSGSTEGAFSIFLHFFWRPLCQCRGF